MNPGVLLNIEKIQQDPPRLSKLWGPDQFRPGVAVTPPLRFKVDQGTYICGGSGLNLCIRDGKLKKQYGLDADFHKHLPPLEPLRTETGEVRVLQPTIQGDVKELAYWKAQCIFRNLPCTGTVEDLQQRLRSSGELGMHGDIAKLGEKLDEEFWKKNAVAQKERWDRLETPEDKLYANAVWFLREAFSKPGVQVLTMKVPVIGYYQKEKVQPAATALDLCHESTYAPPEGDRTMIWVVFGPIQSRVTEEVQRVRAETTRIRQISLEAQAERNRILHEAVVSEATNSDGYWDVGGLWAISCPVIESKWGVAPRGRCLLDIRFAQNRRGGRQMWANFYFMNIAGVFRFMKPKLDGDYSDEESSDEEEEDFYLDFVDWPSQNSSKWEYAWRGEDSISGQTLRGKGKSSLTFGGVGGTKLDGCFQSDLTGIIQFTGMKIGESPRSPSAEWEIIDYKWREHKNES